MKQKVRVAISLGSNLGDRLEFLTLAARRLAGEFLERAQASRVYETEPWRGMDHPLYLNALIVGESEWKPLRSSTISRKSSGIWVGLPVSAMPRGLLTWI